MRNGNAFQLVRQWRTNYNSQVIPKRLRAIGNASGVISLGAVGYEVFHDGNVKSSNVIDAAMGAISFVPGWGWIAGGILGGLIL